jgi:hypothetical protein
MGTIVATPYGVEKGGTVPCETREALIGACVLLGPARRVFPPVS